MNESKEQRTPDDAAPVHPACSASGEVESNFGKAFSGWWWGVWQDGRIVGFGAGYKRKARCFRHERECLESARQRVMPTVECQSGEFGDDAERSDCPSTNKQTNHWRKRR